MAAGAILAEALIWMKEVLGRDILGISLANDSGDDVSDTFVPPPLNSSFFEIDPAETFDAEATASCSSMLSAPPLSPSIEDAVSSSRL